MPNTQVMAGQATATLELLRQSDGLDMLITPIGGGGLSSGSAIAAHGIDPTIKVFGAEPAGADDTAQSLARGARIDHFTANTVCDGLRTLVGESNLEALRAHRVDVITVTDEESIAAMRELWRSLKLVVEVSSATVFAAVLKQRERFAGKRVGLVLTGGNVDLDALPW
jgi:threonine dehydratase